MEIFTWGSGRSAFHTTKRLSPTYISFPPQYGFTFHPTSRRASVSLMKAAKQPDLAKEFTVVALADHPLKQSLKFAKSCPPALCLAIDLVIWLIAFYVAALWKITIYLIDVGLIAVGSEPLYPIVSGMAFAIRGEIWFRSSIGLSSMLSLLVRINIWKACTLSTPGFTLWKREKVGSRPIARAGWRNPT